MKNILIVFAMEVEAKVLFKMYGAKSAKIRQSATKTLDSNTKITALVSGQGCDGSVEFIKQKVQEIKPDFFIQCGFAGACDDSFKIGDFIYETQNQKFQDFCNNLGMKKSKIKTVKEVAGIEKKQELFKEGYAGVEMEFDRFSAFVEPQNRLHIRCISDKLKSRIPGDIFAAITNWDNGDLEFNFKKLTKAILKRPMSIIDFALFLGEYIPAQKIYNKKIVNLVQALNKID